METWAKGSQGKARCLRCQTIKVMSYTSVTGHYQRTHPEIPMADLSKWAVVRDGRTFRNTRGRGFGGRFCIAYNKASEDNAGDQAEDDAVAIASQNETSDQALRKLNNYIK